MQTCHGNHTNFKKEGIMLRKSKKGKKIKKKNKSACARTPGSRKCLNSHCYLLRKGFDCLEGKALRIQILIEINNGHFNIDNVHVSLRNHLRRKKKNKKLTTFST